MSGSIAFGLVAACALASAIFVVRSANLIRAVLWLGVTLLATAVLYAMMDASFLAAVQVLLYVGGVVTLMIFGVMRSVKERSRMEPSSPFASSRLVFALSDSFMSARDDYLMKRIVIG